MKDTATISLERLKQLEQSEIELNGFLRGEIHYEISKNYYAYPTSIISKDEAVKRIRKEQIKEAKVLLKEIEGLSIRNKYLT